MAFHSGSDSKALVASPQVLPKPPQPPSDSHLLVPFTTITSEVITPRPITPTFGYTKETHPHSVGSWLRDVRRDVSWWRVVEGSRGRGVWTCVKFECCV